jgi:hypothetical protein
MTVSDNLILKGYRHPPLARVGFLIQKSIAKFSQRLIQEFEIATPSRETQIKSLSGGNLQKALLAREITAVLFARVEPAHQLQPIESRTVSPVKGNAWHGISKSTTPTLAWQLLPPGDPSNPVIAGAGEADINYDVEIYDNHRLVYAQRQVPDPTHTLSYDIDACKTYRWSVRPSYRVDGVVRYGEWMRVKPEPGAVGEAATPAGNGNVGRKASRAPAYIQDFAQLQIGC